MAEILTARYDPDTRVFDVSGNSLMMPAAGDTNAPLDRVLEPGCGAGLAGIAGTAAGAGMEARLCFFRRRA